MKRKPDFLPGLSSAYTTVYSKYWDFIKGNKTLCTWTQPQEDRIARINRIE